jgi:hypothetical protein
MEPIRLVVDREFQKRFLVTLVNPGELDRSGGPEMAGLYYPAKDVDERIKVLSDEVYEAVKRARETEESLEELRGRNIAYKDDFKSLVLELHTAQDRIKALEDALPLPERLELLAGWFDKCYQGPNKGGTEVQSDLRTWAKRIRAALEVK